MTYRDETASLEERHRMLRRALEETRARSKALTDEEALLHRELASLHNELGAKKLEKRQLPIARSILIATPCDVPWDDMVGDVRVRRCGQCEKDVFNLSAMTRDEIELFLARMGGANGADGVGGTGGRLPCITLWQRADGTVLTADCPVGVRRRRVRSFLAVAIGLGAAAAVSFTALTLITGEPFDLLGRRDQGQVVCGYPKPVVATHTTTTADSGYIVVGGEGGLEVYEDNELKGTVPVSFSAKPGSHTLRIEDPRQRGRGQIVSTEVRSYSVSHVTAYGFVPQAPVVAPPPPVRLTGAPPPARGKGFYDPWQPRSHSHSHPQRDVSTDDDAKRALENLQRLQLGSL